LDVCYVSWQTDFVEVAAIGGTTRSRRGPGALQALDLIARVSTSCDITSGFVSHRAAVIVDVAPYAGSFCEIGHYDI
jgi:hypothetical protein